MESSPFKQSDGIVPVLFHAVEDADIGASLTDLIVEPVDSADRPNFRGGFIQNNQATNRRGDYAIYFDRPRKMALAVVDGATSNLEIERPSIPLVRNGELSSKVKVQRHEGFEGAVYCEADWLPVGVNKQPPLIIPAGETEGTYKVSAASSAAAGEHRISIYRSRERRRQRSHDSRLPFYLLAVRPFDRRRALRHRQPGSKRH
jgi:hypothetical protein